ncbi:MAG TPA: hypothetical protein VM577_13680 [Anaerovoracaceae bacterium]|nr:hypothetical protein [Anaerovoracaceae bacterium]
MDMSDIIFSQNIRDYDTEKSKKESDPEAVSSTAATNNAERQDKGDVIFTEEQIRYFKDKYDLLKMTKAEQETFIQDLYRMGILTIEEASIPLIRAETQEETDFFNSLTRQIKNDIHLLYQMAISGKDSSKHIENIKSKQKVLDILEQLLAE